MQDKILIIDDEKINRKILSDILSIDYEIIAAQSGEEGLKILRERKDEIVLVLLSYALADMSGIEVLEITRKEKALASIPIVILSEDINVDVEEICLEKGCTEFIVKPFKPSVVKKRISNVISASMYCKQLEEQVEKQTRKLVDQYDKLKLHSSILEQMNEEIIDILGTVVGYRSLESGNHIQCVKRYTKILGKYIIENFPEYNLTKKDLKVIVAASALHDVGKVAISDAILLKPGRLTAEEFEEMKTHSDKGCKIIQRIKSIWSDDYAKYSYEICRHHHERYDGKGYPDNLEGEEIPISAQLVSLADVYDALTNERCYKDAFAVDKAYNMIMNGECGVFSPKLLEALKYTRNELEEAVMMK